MGEDFDDAEDENAPGSSAMSLFKEFTAVSKFTVSVELLGWRGAGAYNFKGNTAADTARVAASIIAQSPPNMGEFNCFTSMLVDDTDFLNDMDSYRERSGRSTPRSRYVIAKDFA
ncbi:hypothetical protein Sste5346_005151 [Sporothrix stenoceras]|uniref:Uncharacterized protein n=1 Tax=Sporothrix stenoceras TaxID=5173 RepID=A0ABR3Z6H3_9PEZI